MGRQNACFARSKKCCEVLSVIIGRTDQSPEDLWHDKSLNLVIPDTSFDEPLLLAVDPGGLRLTDKPADAHLFNQQLHAMADEAEMQGSNATWYSISKTNGNDFDQQGWSGHG